MDIDCEEVTTALALLADNLPLRNKGFTTRRPCLTCRFNATWIKAQCRAVDNFGLIESATLVGLVETDKRRVVKVSDSDITTGLASVLVVGRRNVDESIVRTSGCTDSLGEGTQSNVCGYDWT